MHVHIIFHQNFSDKKVVLPFQKKNFSGDYALTIHCTPKVLRKGKVPFMDLLQKNSHISGANFPTIPKPIAISKGPGPSLTFHHHLR